MHDLIDWVTHLNWVDFVFLVVILYSIITGAWLGFLAECMTVAGITIGTVVAGLAYNSGADLLAKFGVPQNARQWVAFVALFLIISIAFRILAIFARNISRTMVSGWSNTVSGALLGLIAGSAICLFALVAVAFFQIGHLIDPLNHSKLAAASSSWLREYTALLPEKMHTIPGFLP